MKKGVMSIFIVVFILIAMFLHNQNNDISVTDIDFKSSKIPNKFSGYKILQISDLHNKEFGKDNYKLIDRIKDINPSVIVITGDLIDSRRTNINKAINFVNQAINICDVYYTPGNHEGRINEYKEFERKLINCGVNVLSNDNKIIEIGNDKINLIGMEDISFINSKNNKKEFSSMLSNIKNENKDNFNILLSHRPDLIDVYDNVGIDLVFTGHAHGGQIRLPFLGGLFAPDQGILPKYVSGIHKKENTSMIVSRGLGNSLFPFRIFNKPEIILTTLNASGSD